LPIKDVKTITPDRGKEFAKHVEITEETGIEFYFPDPHAPWQRGTNENTNNLLREYLPKSQDMSDIPAPEFAEYAHKLNTRPKKCLGWRTPYEVFYNETLHLI
ncbi:IS30 family transposase, partial [Staphylococcus epidermidis]